MTPDQLREAYLSFFESKGHARYPSDSLVPANDPTLLFTGAGMNQFKEMFLGVGNLPDRRITTAQKCLRTGDLDNVGRTDYHHTFFEMLGNFSFGDYFKREAILWQWEFLTRVLGLPVEKLWVAVYEEDDEAHAIWKDDVGFPADRIWRLDARSNFWPANAPEEGPNGPCGPCSEIFFDYGSPGAEGDPEADRYCEIGNIVFTQFNRVGKHDLEPLAQKNIDTGMGFERILAVLSGVRSNYETGLFRPLLKRLEKSVGRPYVFEADEGRLWRRIADHVRAATFLVADGVKPSNEGRGYVARRILRRAIRDGIALGVGEPFLHTLVPVVADVMGKAYPEVVRARPAAEAFLRAEDEKFRETFETGMALLEREIGKLRGTKTLAGETAFVLYDSHGFPFELCEEICRERGLAVDRAGFDACMERQRTRSREGSAIADEVFVASAVTAIKKDAPATEFLGYTDEEAESEVVAVLDGGQAVVVRATPFYAEAGGQVGDTGVIESANGLFRVRDTRKIEGYVVHHGAFERGAFERGEKVRLAVDGARRDAIRRNHTATHLLHAGLRTILGTHVTQAGSLVDPDRLRFDFTHPQAVKPDELAAIEEWVNDEVLRNAPVVTERMELEKARARGAMALFGEKYEDVVRVVTVGAHSIELCGGTHVGASAEIGAALLTQETSVAAGVRRIEMVTGEGSLALARRQRGALRDLAAALKATPETVGERIEALQKELRDLKRNEAERRKASGLSAVDALLADAVEAGGITLVVGEVDGDDGAALRSVSDAVRARAGECFVLLVGRGADGAAVVATATDGAVAAGVRAGDVLRDFARGLGGKGGGKPPMAQGRIPSAEGAPAALAAARDGLAAALRSR